MKRFFIINSRMLYSKITDINILQDEKMIQDIYPHTFDNQYRPDAKPGDCSPVLCFADGSVLVKKVMENNSCPVVFPSYADIGSDPADTVYAFEADGQEYYIDISGSTFIPDGFEYMSVRQIRRIASNINGMIIFTGYHLFQWYVGSRYCGACGSLTSPDKNERAMVCPSCGHKRYPSIFPAVIVGVTDGDRLLVTKYREGFDHYALVAGFAEIGETFEETVSREVMEETGLKVKNIRYYKSQPWGIAQDILAGFFCEVDGDNTIAMDQNELKLAEWKSREKIELQPDSFSLTNEMMKLFKEGKWSFLF